MDNNLDNFIGSDFYGRIANGSNIRAEDVLIYILATSDFTKGMQSDTNHYVRKDRMNNANFRQKLDPISKNILRQQIPLELVFEDISTFDAENSIVGSLLKELDVGKKVLASDLIKQAPGPPGQDFAIRNRLNKLNDRRNQQQYFPSSITDCTSSSWSWTIYTTTAASFSTQLPVFNSFQLPPPRSDNSYGNFHILSQLSSASFNNT